MAKLQDPMPQKTFGNYLQDTGVTLIVLSILVFVTPSSPRERGAEGRSWALSCAWFRAESRWKE